MVKVVIQVVRFTHRANLQMVVHPLMALKKWSFGRLPKPDTKKTPVTIYPVTSG